MDLGPRGEGPEDGNGDFTGRTSGRVIKGHPVFQGGEDVMTPITISDVGRFIVEVLAMAGIVAVFGLIALAWG